MAFVAPVQLRWSMPTRVFQIASVSKPIASTVVASLVSTGNVTWNERIADLDPKFKLSNPDITAEVTIRDFFSHRSSLPGNAGELLEELGYARPEILERLREYPLNGGFRKIWDYSNFGITEGALAAARTTDKPWEEVASERLYDRLGMTSTSSRYSDYDNRPNKAFTHVFVDGKAVTQYRRVADSESPAGGVSSSVRDLAQWVRLQLANGRYNGEQVIDSAALAATHEPIIIRNPAAPTQFYGLGWNVDFDSRGKKIINHSGAFLLGTGTTVYFSPYDNLGIIVLANSTPVGLPEATAETFFDWVRFGKQTKDWLTLFRGAFQGLVDDAQKSSTDYSKLTPPTSPTPSRALPDYLGTYRNAYYGDITIEEYRNQLIMRLPPRAARYELTHWDGELFTYFFAGESNIGVRGVNFMPGANGAQLNVENLIGIKGIFTRTES